MNRTRPLVCGVGIIDTDHPVVVTSKIEGKWKTTWKCPFYTRWQQMMIRCYSNSHQLSHPAYVGCTVHEDWHSLSRFTEWAKSQYSEGLALDKDILVKDNTVYSPDTCCFVPQYINNLFLVRDRNRGDYPLGVSKSGKKYQAFCRGVGNGNLGRYDTPEEAHRKWQECKIGRIKEVLEKYKKEIFYNEVVYTAICGRITTLEEDLLCKKETLSL